MAKETRFFSDTSNCYGFAVKRKTTSYGNQTAVPGGERLPIEGLSSQATGDRLKEGVLRDGGPKVAFISQYAVQALNASNVPSATGNRYLIAMLTNNVGFHFVRRQKSKLIGDPFWKWKEGNEGMEERNAMDKGSGDWVRVTDARLPALVKRELFGLRTLFEHIYFFEVDEGGFDI